MDNEFGEYSGFSNSHYYSLSLLQSSQARRRNMQYESKFATLENKSKQKRESPKKEDKHNDSKMTRKMVDNGNQCAGSNQGSNTRCSTKSSHNDADGRQQGQFEKEANQSAEYNRALMQYLNRNNAEEMVSFCRVFFLSALSDCTTT